MTKKRILIISPRNIKTIIMPACLVALTFYGFWFLHAGIVFFKAELWTGKTSTSYRYDKSFAQTLNRYEQLGQMYLSDMSFAIPGLSNTNVLGMASSQMVPQGICKAGDYILISAYNASANNSALRRKETIQNSVIYILNDHGVYLNTMVLPDVNHVGGLTFDGYYVWVAKSQDRTCSVISYDTIEAVAKDGESSIFLDNYLADQDCERESSFVEYYDGKLWIGTFADQGQGSSEVGIYDIGDLDDSLKLKEVATLELPARAQGISFFQEDGVDYMLVSTSYGRWNNSFYYLYKLNQFWGHYSIDYLGKCEMPPMSEEMYNDGQYCYMLYESAATRYSEDMYYRCKDPIDRICVVEIKQFLAFME